MSDKISGQTSDQMSEQVLKERIRRIENALVSFEYKAKRCMTEGLFNDANTIAAASAVIYSAHTSGIKPYGLLEIERDIWPRYKKAFEAFERKCSCKI